MRHQQGKKRIKQVTATRFSFCTFTIEKGTEIKYNLSE